MRQGMQQRRMCASQMSERPMRGRVKAPVTDRKAYLSKRVSDTAELMSAVVQAREIILLAFGENKASTVAKAVEGPVSPSVPASFLQEHPMPCSTWMRPPVQAASRPPDRSCCTLTLLTQGTGAYLWASCCIFYGWDGECPTEAGHSLKLPALALTWL